MCVKILVGIGGSNEQHTPAARERMDFRLHVLIVGADPVPDALPMADFRWAWKARRTLPGWRGATGEGDRRPARRAAAAGNPVTAAKPVGSTLLPGLSWSGE